MLKPKLVVALGATAEQALLGTSFRVTQSHSQVLDLPPESFIVATVHPSAILRSPDRDTEYGKLLADLRVAATVTT